MRYERVSAVLFLGNSRPVVREPERRRAQREEPARTAVELIRIEHQTEEGARGEAAGFQNAAEPSSATR
jgi:hypothetical protein